MFSVQSPVLLLVTCDSVIKIAHLKVIFFHNFIYRTENTKTWIHFEKNVPYVYECNSSCSMFYKCSVKLYMIVITVITWSTLPCMQKDQTASSSPPNHVLLSRGKVKLNLKQEFKNKKSSKQKLKLCKTRELNKTWNKTIKDSMAFFSTCWPQSVNATVTQDFYRIWMIWNSSLIWPWITFTSELKGGSIIVCVIDSHQSFY